MCESSLFSVGPPRRGRSFPRAVSDAREHGFLPPRLPDDAQLRQVRGLSFNLLSAPLNSLMFWFEPRVLGLTRAMDCNVCAYRNIVRVCLVVSQSLSVGEMEKFSGLR